MRQNDAQAAEDGEVQIQGRDQVQLKDRARNLKIAFLRYVPVCHLNFLFSLAFFMQTGLP
jgi:hypothetical protein